MRVEQSARFFGQVCHNNLRTETRLANFSDRKGVSVGSNAVESRAFGSLNPLLSTTRINAITIPLVGSGTEFSQVEAELSHHEWLASLEPRIRNVLDSHGDAEWLSHLDAEGRREIVKNAEQALVDLEYVHRLLKELGTGVVTLNVQFYPQRLTMAFFEGLGDEDDNRILIRFEDESELFFNVPRTFTSENFNRFLIEDLPRLMNENNLMDTRASVSQLRNIFEDFFMS